MKTGIMDMLKRTKGNRTAANVDNDFGTDDDEEFKPAVCLLHLRQNILEQRAYKIPRRPPYMVELYM